MWSEIHKPDGLADNISGVQRVVDNAANAFYYLAQKNALRERPERRRRRCGAAWVTTSTDSDVRKHDKSWLRRDSRLVVGDIFLLCGFEHFVLRMRGSRIHSLTLKNKAEESCATWHSRPKISVTANPSSARFVLPPLQALVLFYD